MWNIEDGLSADQAIEGRRGWFRVKRCARYHAERQDSFYPGDCDCPWEEVERKPVVRTECRDCGEKSKRAVIDDRPNQTEWEVDRAFPCRHWRDHEVAAARALATKSGRSRSGPVSARISSWR